ncbi:MAG: PAS domain S-box protein [Sandaracinaceae bacterium]|nr:PAS domain S-box protein [Sandaracinaceae bacterium]
MKPSPAAYVFDHDADRRARAVASLGTTGLVEVSTLDELAALLAEDTEPPSVVILPADAQVLASVREELQERVTTLVLLDGEPDAPEDWLALGATDVLLAPLTVAQWQARARLARRGHLERLRLAEAANDAETLLELTQRLTSSLDFRDILFSVVRRVARAIGSARISIVLAPDTEGSAPDETGYVMVASDDETLTNLAIDLADYPEIREVLRERQPLTIDDVRTHPVLAGVNVAQDLGAMVLIPIVWETQAIGVFFLRLETPHRVLLPREMRYCQAVANATAVALRNARVMQSLRDHTQEVTFARFEAERRLAGLERYAELFASAAEGIAVLASDGTLLFANPRAHEMLGYSADEMKGLAIKGLVSEAERERTRALWDGFSAGVYPRGADIRFRRRDGEEVILNCSFAALAIGDATVLVSCQDVTVQRQTEAELIKTMEFLESLIDASVDGIVAGDMDGNIVLFNPSAERIYGYRAADVVGRMNLADLYDGEGWNLVRERLMSGSHGGFGRLVPTRVDAKGSDGEQIPIQISAALIFERGEPVATFGIFTDLRERLRTQQRLAEVHQKLEHTERQAVLAELAGTAAHELNQPLTSIMAYAELLERKLTPGTAEHRAAGTMVSEAQRMADIVRKIGRVTKYETRSYVGEQKILDLDRASSRGSSPGDE